MQTAAGEPDNLALIMFTTLIIDIGKYNVMKIEPENISANVISKNGISHSW